MGYDEEQASLWEDYQSGTISKKEYYRGMSDLYWEAVEQERDCEDAY